MRKIITREVKEKKERMGKLIIGLILVGIMVLSTAGYAFFQTEKDYTEKIEYKGVEFVLKDDGLWHFKIDNSEFATLYNAKDAENITSSENLNLQNFYGKALYFTYDSERDTINEIVKNLGRFMIRVQEVCVDECDKDLPIKNCSDNVVIAKEGNETLIKQEENCVYITGKKEELAKLGDAFIFKFLEI